jgi:hypothetical protein
MKSAAQIFGDIQMILARRLAGDLNDSEVVQKISDMMGTADAVSISLEDLAPDTRRRGIDGKGDSHPSWHLQGKHHVVGHYGEQERDPDSNRDK